MAWLDFVRVGIVMVASSVGVALAFALLERYAFKPKKDVSIVKPSILYIVIGAIDIGICALIMYLSVIHDKMYLFIPAGPVIVGSVWLILRGALWKITIEEDGIVFRNTFGKTQKYLYSEITEIKDERLGFVIKIGKKKIGVDMFNSNFSELRAVLARNCQKELFEQRRSPKLSKRERKRAKEKEMSATKNSKKHSCN